MDPLFAREAIYMDDFQTAACCEEPVALTLALARFKSQDPRIHQMKAELSFITRFTREDSLNVFISGETGTGKELFAAAIGALRPQRFVAVNCAALPHDLIESELFGHRKGAFTGAVDDKPGLIHAANEGVMFLDEIGDMPLAAQAKLLRVMSTRKLRRVGDTQDQPYSVSCRFVGATHRDIHQLIAVGQFREDLYWRLAQWTFNIPPLRERRGDILDIIHSIEDWTHLTEDNITELCDPTLVYSGNTRELFSRVSQMILRNKMIKLEAARAHYRALKAPPSRV